MTVLRCGSALAAALLVLASSVSAGGDKISIVGDWEIVSMTKDNIAAPKDVVENVFLRVTATALVPVTKKDLKEQEKEKLDYKIVGPKEIDLYQVLKLTKKGEDKETESTSLRRGIFELSGDTLKICWSGGAIAKKDKDGKIEPGEAAPPRAAAYENGVGKFNAVLKRKAK